MKVGEGSRIWLMIIDVQRYHASLPGNCAQTACKGRLQHNDILERLSGVQFPVSMSLVRQGLDDTAFRDTTSRAAVDHACQFDAKSL